MPLRDEMVQLQITRDNIGSFLSCLAIGTLEAMRRGTLSADAGIWSLGAPKVWEPLAKRSMISQGLVEVLEKSDELSAIQVLLPDHYDAVLEEMISQLHDEFSKFSDPVWQLEWLLETD